eukprot:gene5366-2708_t
MTTLAIPATLHHHQAAAPVRVRELAAAVAHRPEAATRGTAGAAEACRQRRQIGEASV